MNFSILRRIGLFSIIGATLLCFASCVSIDEQLGKNLIPTAQRWKVYSPAASTFSPEDIQMMAADSLSGYSSRRFTLGAINSDNFSGLCTKGTSFTLVPVIKDLDLGKNAVVKQFHFSAVRDTLSMADESQERILQNIYAYSLQSALDSTILYTNALSPGVKYSNDSEKTNQEKFIDFSKYITNGIPVYKGGDSL